MGNGLTLFDTLSLPIHLLVSMHVFNVVGRRNLQPPKSHPEDELEHSMLLRRISAAPALMPSDIDCSDLLLPARVYPDLAKLMPPSADDRKHLNEWLETADYATSALVMLAGIFHLDGGCMRSPQGMWVAWLYHC
jgi:hypothetical protein